MTIPSGWSCGITAWKSGPTLASSSEIASDASSAQLLVSTGRARSTGVPEPTMGISKSESLHSGVELAEYLKPSPRKVPGCTAHIQRQISSSSPELNGSAYNASTRCTMSSRCRHFAILLPCPLGEAVSSNSTEQRVCAMQYSRRNSVSHQQYHTKARRSGQVPGPRWPP